MTQKFPFALAILGMILGVFIAILFGANEAIFKDKIAKDLNSNQSITSIIDNSEREAKIENEKAKNWRYYQRFHFHSTGISTMSLSVLVLLAFCLAPQRLKLVSSYMLAIGGFLYPFVWLFAAIYGPIMGRGAAKETFAIFGYMGGVFLVGLVLAIITLIRYPVKFIKES